MTSPDDCTIAVFDFGDTPKRCIYIEITSGSDMIYQGEFTDPAMARAVYDRFFEIDDVGELEGKDEVPYRSGPDVMMIAHGRTIMDYSEYTMMGREMFPEWL